MRLSEWIKDASNLQAYQNWVKNPVTQMVVQGLKEESRPKMLPLDRVCGEMALHLQGQAVGEWRILDRLMNIDRVAKTPDDTIATYNMFRYLVEMGYTEEDAKRMVEDYENAR